METTVPPKRVKAKAQFGALSYAPKRRTNYEDSYKSQIIQDNVINYSKLYGQHQWRRKLENIEGGGCEKVGVKGGYSLENSSVLANLFTANGTFLDLYLS